MTQSIHSEMAEAFTHMSRKSALNELYAKRAKREKRSLLSKLLGAVSRSEHIHARRSLMYIRGKMGDLDEYLSQLVHSKHIDTAQRYPQLSERLNEAGQKKAAEAFEQLSRVAAVHEKLLNAVIEDTAGGTREYYVCDVCGYIAPDQPPDNCPVCNAVKEKFKP